ncbi:MAG: major capsid protein [Campylobacterales bacterium]|nr:major capsid protein [Campylobacterales bacterium]
MDMFELKTLTEAVNKIPAAKTFIWDKVFKGSTPKQELTTTIEVDIKVGKRTLAPFVGYGDEAAVMKKTGMGERVVKIPHIRLKEPLTGKELLTQKGAGQNIYVVGGDINTYRDKKLAEAQLGLKNTIQRRQEWMACQALNGSISYSDENISFAIDYQMPSQNKPVLTGAALWSTSTADPVKDIKRWKKIIAKSGKTASTMIFGDNVLENFLNNSKVQKLWLEASKINGGSIDLTLGDFVGRILGLDSFEYSETYVDSADVEHNMIDPDSVVIVATDARNEVHCGIVEDLEADITIAAPYFSKSWLQSDPSARWLLVESNQLPVVFEPEAIVYVKVL